MAATPSEQWYRRPWMTEDAKGEPVAEARPSQPGLDAQRALQDAITDELVELASRLKLSALAVHGKLDERARYLDDTEQAVETSLAGVAVSNKETEKRRKALRAGLCFQLFVLLWVFFTVSVVYAFIRLTTIAGYRWRSLPKALPRDPPPPIPTPTPIPEDAQTLREL